MRRRIILLVVAIAVIAAIVAFTRGGGDDDGAWLGYVEGDYLRLGPREAGLVTSLEVREGDQVAAGETLFSIDAERARLAVMEADARLEAAQARAEDLTRGGRPQEIAAAEQQLAQANADLALAQRDFTRTQELVEEGAAPAARLDQDRRGLAAARARVSELQSRLDLARAPAREDQIAAAQREAEAARAALELAMEQLDDRSVTAPKAGRVDAIYLRDGEYAAPGAPVLSLLPPDNIKAVFFAPEDRLSSLSVGDRVGLSCDGCPDTLAGSITHIASRAEFAPPLIYSEDARAKLVFRVEARPDPDAPWGLAPGQPVEAHPAP